MKNIIKEAKKSLEKNFKNAEYKKDDTKAMTAEEITEEVKKQEAAEIKREENRETLKKEANLKAEASNAKNFKDAAYVKDNAKEMSEEELFASVNALKEKEMNK